jgi:hypothetical protein
MTDTHPVTPPSHLLELWCAQHYDYNKGINELLIEASQWGSDTELEACCEWVTALAFDGDWEIWSWATSLRTARRPSPKPPSLKEQAQAELKRLIALIPTEGAIAMAEPIRRALEQLDD